MTDDDFHDTSVESLADDGHDELEMFPVGSIAGEGPSPQSLVNKGLPIELTVSMSRAEVPMTGQGLLDPNEGGRLLVSILPGKVDYVPVREDKDDPDRVSKWKIRQNVRVTYTQQVADIPSLIRSLYEELAAGSRSDAEHLLQQLHDLTGKALAAV